MVHIPNRIYRVPNAPQNANIPHDGILNFSDFYGGVGVVEVTYEIIGAGGGGGSGWTTANRGTDGGDSTLTYTENNVQTTITSPGGAGGRGGIQTGWSDGSRSYYGPGGRGGANSDSSRQTAGYPAPATSYGAGGGGGGANSFASRNGGEGGYAGGEVGSIYTVTAWNSSSTITRYEGYPSTGTVTLVVGDQVDIVIGIGGTNIRPDPGTDGRPGANGYCKLTIDGIEYEFFTSTTFTVPVPL